MTYKLHHKIIGEGPPLVLLHGWGWSSGIWKPLVPRLATHYQLFLLDLPGFGSSDELIQPYTLDIITTLLFDVVPEQATWLGWSLGGAIAWWIAIHYPEKVTRLMTVASSPKFVAEQHWPGISKETLKKFADALIKNPAKTLEDFLALQLRGSPHSEELFAELKKQISNQYSMNALLGGLALLRETDLRAHLNKFIVPSLHIFGSHDTIVPVTLVPVLQPLLKHGQCEIIQRAGHIPFLSQMESFLKLILS